MMNEEPASPEQRCPVCRGAIPLGDLPEKCPHCSHRLGATHAGFFADMLRPFFLYFTIRGRATRREYWSFSLTFGVLDTLLSIYFSGMLMIAPLIARCEVPNKFADILLWGGGISGALWLLLFVPYCTVTARRLHDINYSAWWMGASVVINFLTYVTVALIIEEVASVLELPRILDGDLTRQTMAELLERVIAPWRSLAEVLGLLGNALGILIFVFCLLDSQRGSNKYGPSSKYPET